MSTCDANFNPELKHPAAKQSCNECPFRKDNQGKPQSAGWFEPENVTRLWRAIAHGSTLGCHKFDSPEITGFDELAKLDGYKTPVNINGRKECAGTTGLIWREIEAAENYDTYEEYHAARPYGLQRGAWAVVYQRLNGEELKLTQPAPGKDQELIDLSTYIDTTSMWWKYSKPQMEAMVAGLFEVADNYGWDLSKKSCDCVVCVKHEEAHVMAELQLADGSTVQVDQVLMPVLKTFAHVGIQTTASCENLQSAIKKLAPELLDDITGPSQWTVNYAEAVSNGKAFTRFRTNSKQAVQLIKNLRSKDSFVVTVAQEEAQVTFSLEDQDELIDTINALPAQAEQ